MLSFCHNFAHISSSFLQHFSTYSLGRLDKMHTAKQNQLKVYLAICLIDEGLFMPSIWQQNMFQWCSYGWKHQQHIIGELFSWQHGCLFSFLSTSNQHKMPMCSLICLDISKVYGNDLVMLGSWIMCTLYTNECTFGQLKLQLGL